jgi:hypothetical protein
MACYVKWERAEVRAAIAEIFVTVLAFLVLHILELVKDKDLVSRVNIGGAAGPSEPAPPQQTYNDPDAPTQEPAPTSETNHVVVTSTVQEYSQFDDLMVYMMFHICALAMAIFSENGIETAIFAWLHFLVYAAYAALIVRVSLTAGS